MNLYLHTQDPAELIEADPASQAPVEPPRFDAAIVLGKNIGIGWHREQIQEAKGHLSDHSRMNVLAAGMMYKSGEAGKIIFSTGLMKFFIK